MRTLVKLFKALSDSNRIRILKMLEIRPLCVCEITEILQLATSTVSKHLSILRNVDLILDTKEGRWVNYELNHSGKDLYVNQILLLMINWIADDEIIIKDAERVQVIDRNVICG